MPRPNSHRYLPALTVLAGLVSAVTLGAVPSFARPVSAGPGSAPESELSATRSPAAESLTQASAQSAAGTTAAGSAASASAAAQTQIPAQIPEVAKPPQSTAAVVQPPSTPEEVGDALMVQQRYQAAIEAYQKSMHRSAELWNKLGIAYQLMFNQEEASHCYQASLRLEPKNSRVLNNLGTIYDSEKEYSNAERMYHKALKADPHSALIYKNLGTNLLAQHKYKKGWEMYQTALQIDPNIFRSSTSPRVQNPASVEDRGAMNYYMAKGCMRVGLNDCAIEYLRMALNEGFTSPKKIQADSEFAGLKGLPAFQQLLASQRQQ